MARELRLAAALRRDEAEGNHLAVAIGKAVARVVVAEAVVGEPLVDMRALSGTMEPGLAHTLAKVIDLHLVAGGKARLERGGCLALKGKLDAVLLEHFIHRADEREGAADAEVRRALVDDFLDLDGRHAEVESTRHHDSELIDALATHERGENGEEALAIGQLSRLLVDHLVKGERIESLGELRIGGRERARDAGIHALKVGRGSI